MRMEEDEILFCRVSCCKKRRTAHSSMGNQGQQARARKWQEKKAAQRALAAKQAEADQAASDVEDLPRICALRSELSRRRGSRS